MRIAVVTPIPTPYRDAFWNVVAALPDVELHVLYCASGKADRPWKKTWKMSYHHIFMQGWNLASWKSREASQYLNPGVVSHLNRIRPEIILIGGYNHLTMFLAMWWAIKNRVAFYMMCETFRFEQGNRLGAVLKRKLLCAIAKQSAGGFPTGEAAARYLKAHGWKDNALSYLPNVPDIELIHIKTKKYRNNHAELKSKWEIKDENIILYVGRLVKKKNVDLLLKALAKIETKPKPMLVIIGDGDESSNLKAISQQLGVDHVTRFLGFREPEAVLEWFALASVFALPSNETLGVAPIEAASAGLHLILSETVGSGCEISKRYPNIQIVQEGQIQQWQEAICKVLGSKNDLLNEQRDLPESSKMIQEWSYNALADEMISFLNSQQDLIAV